MPSPLSGGFGGGQSASATATAGPATGSAELGGGLVYNASSGISTGVIALAAAAVVLVFFILNRKAKAG